jgi:two-component system cell cycle sensor histidine kinase/response regulator CckA
LKSVPDVRLAVTLLLLTALSAVMESGLPSFLASPPRWSWSEQAFTETPQVPRICSLLAIAEIGRSRPLSKGDWGLLESYRVSSMQFRTDARWLLRRVVAYGQYPARSGAPDQRPPVPLCLAMLRVNFWLASTLALDVVLILIIVILLSRNGRYRHTLFAKAFRSSPLAITISTLAEGRYVDVNDAFLQMLNYERMDVVGRTATDLRVWADPEDRVRMLQQLGKASITKGLSTKLRTRSGEMREVNLSAELIELDGVPCVLAVTQDVTEAKRMESQLRQAHRMGAVGRLAGGVAHDFNNILTVIMGYSEVVIDRLGPSHPAANNLGEIKRAAERAASLTRQLLAFSRQQVLYPRVLDLNAVVNHLNQMLLRMIGEDVSLSFRPADPLGHMKADLGQIEQILMNLVVNARDAMPDGGTIVIETSNVQLDDGYRDSHFSVQPGRYVVLSVTDTGCGIDDKTMPHIFEPFFTTKGPGQGIGLGLSTVYGIVKQSDGYIWVYSEPGKGTTLKLYFPRHQENPQPDVHPRPEVESPRGSETILVVEDDEPLRKFTTALLESTGYRVLVATNGEDATTLVSNSAEPINLLLTDVLMPAVNGVELSARLRKLRPGLKVLLMSGYAGDLIARHRSTDPQMMLIEKPFTRHELLEKIRSALHTGD